MHAPPSHYPAIRLTLVFILLENQMHTSLALVDVFLTSITQPADFVGQQFPGIWARVYLPKGIPRISDKWQTTVDTTI